MTFYEKLIQEFGAAIKAILGDQAEEEFDANEITESEIRAIAQKVLFYIK